MKDYLMLFRNVSGNGAYVSTAEDMARDMPAWQAWIGQIAMQGKLVSSQPITSSRLSALQISNPAPTPMPPTNW